MGREARVDRPLLMPSGMKALAIATFLLVLVTAAIAVHLALRWG